MNEYIKMEINFSFFNFYFETFIFELLLFNIVCVSVIYIGKGNEDGVEPPLLKGWTKGGLRQPEARS